MNILLTGGAGFIGSHTAVELLNAGHDVVVVDNLYNSSEKVIDRVEELTGKKVKFYNADACDFAAMDRILNENAVDAVIHFAAYKAVGESVAKPLEYYRNNLDCTLTVCEAMKKHGVKRFIFSSSATVYGIPDHMPLDETMPTSCTNPYGWTKYMNERILTDVAKANPDWSVVLLRYFNPIGAHESGRIGEMPNGIPNNLLPYVGYSVLDIVKAFEKVNGVKVPYKIEARRPGDIAECWADPTKAKELLGWTAQKNLEDMCRDAWRWQTQNPNGYAD